MVRFHILTFKSVFKHFEPFFKSRKIAKIEHKVKANPLPFWSILASFSTFYKWFKNEF